MIHWVFLVTRPPDHRVDRRDSCFLWSELFSYVPKRVFLIFYPKSTFISPSYNLITSLYIYQVSKSPILILSNIKNSKKWITLRSKDLKAPSSRPYSRILKFSIQDSSPLFISKKRRGRPKLVFRIFQSSSPSNFCKNFVFIGMWGYS